MKKIKSIKYTVLSIKYKALLFLLLNTLYFVLSAYCQNDTIIHIDDHKNLTDSLPGFSNQTPVLNDSLKNQIVTEKRKVYKFNLAVDIPIVAVGTGWSLYAFTKIYQKGSSTDEEILSLKKSNINSFDRWAVRPYSQSIDKVSYYPFYAAMPLPLIFFLTGEQTRDDFWQLGFLYWETMSVEGLFGTGATYFVDRYRPYTYSDGTPLDVRESQNAKNSFYAGHVEIMAISTFFISKVYADYYPDSKIKWVFYSGAVAATAGMGYLRLDAGMHFPSDILLGATMGALTGILVPQFHKHKLIKNHELGIVPVKTGEILGFYLTYK